jgi:hypothetical protein
MNLFGHWCPADLQGAKPVTLFPRTHQLAVKLAFLISAEARDSKTLFPTINNGGSYSLHPNRLSIKADSYSQVHLAAFVIAPDAKHGGPATMGFYLSFLYPKYFSILNCNGAIATHPCHHNKGPRSCSSANIS